MALYATNRFAGDGTTTQYEINFAGKYIDRSHVKAYTVDDTTQVRTPVTIAPGQWLNASTITGFAPTPVGQTLVIYRDTPKAPLVDFVNGSRFTEHNMDLVTRQGLFVAIEAMDAGDVEQAREQLLDAIAVIVGLSGDATAAKTAAEAALASIDGRYLGHKSSDPTTDNGGGALLVGTLYFRTTAPIGMKVWTGAAWDDAYANLSSKFDKTGGDVNGDINFTGTARRITGDFSNAAIGNRVMFQTHTVNGNTVVSTLPNGSSTTSGFRAYGSDNLVNGISADLIASIASGDVRLVSNAHGAGAYLPLAFHTGGSERMRIDTSGNVLATSGALGYGVGAGGTVVQATSKATAVTLNKPAGQITMNNAALGAGTAVFFQLNNSLISGVDTVQVTTFGGGSAYLVDCVSVSAGAALIRVVNNTGGSLSNAVILNFSVIKGATS